MDIIRVFYSYAHEDERLRKKLETHLGLLQQQGLIASWHDRNISAGTEWAQEISDNFNTAQIILLLVSASFLASQYCYSREMIRALERHADGSARVIPIILRPVYWENAPFSHLQVLPKDAKPITKWANQDEAFFDVVKGIRDAIEGLGRKETGPETHFMLLTDLSIEIGPAIAKSILKLWLKDLNIVVDAASTVIDMLKSKTTDRVAQKRGQRQFEAIGEKVGESLLPIFEAHSDLNKGRYTAVALAVAETLNTISGEATAKLNLDPSHLAKYLLNKHPATNYHFSETETLVYQRIVSESCAYIVDIASQLPTFHKDTFVEILKQEGQILSVANEILEEVRRIRKQLSPEEKDAQEATHFELEYRRAVLRNLDTLQLFGTDVATSSRRHRLSMAYIMLSVKQKAWETSQQESVRGMTVGRSEGETLIRASSPQSQQHEISEDETLIGASSHQSPSDVTRISLDLLGDEGPIRVSSPQSRQKEIPKEIVRVLGDQGEALKSQVMIIQTGTKPVISVDEALARSQRLFIRGLAGSGKTTLLQWIAVTSASQSFKKPLENWNDTLPFYIRLRSCVQSGLPAPEAFPKFVTTSIAGIAPKGWVHAKLASGRAVLLVDGLDEVPTLQREDVRSWLKDLVDTYPKAYFIITSRPHALEEKWLDDEGFEHAELQPMALSDIYTFIDHWHAAVAEEVTDTEEKAELPSLAKHLKEEVQQNRAKRELATNPLLCAMLCALNRERRQNLPSDRIELYEVSCQILIERRDKERRVPLTDYPAQALTYRQKRALLEDFAYWLIKNGWSEIELYHADERFTRKLKGMHNISSNISGINIRLLFLERTGIVRETVASHIGFTHRTFQEFLAAQAILEEGDIGVLIEHAHNDQWWEVIILTSGLATKKVRGDLLLGLIDRGDTEKENRYPLHMLAVACLDTSIEVEAVVKQDIQQCLNELVPPKNIEEAKALAKAGELAVPFLAYSPRYSPSTATACVFALAHIGSNTALDVLKGYIHSSESEVTKELLIAQHLFDKRMYAQRILAGMLENIDILSIYLSSLEGFQYLTNLKSLNLTRCRQIKDFNPLASLTQLTYLDLTECSQIEDLTFLASLTQLTQLSLAGCWQIKDLTPLANLTRLSYLDLTDCSNICDLTPLANLTQLTYLDLTHCEQIKDLTPLVSLTQLTDLSLAACRQIEDLSPLASLTQLTILDLARCWQVSNLGPLSSLTQLTLLNLSYCDRVRDLSSLLGLKNLKRLDLHGIPYWIRLDERMKEVFIQPSAIMMNGAED